MSEVTERIQWRFLVKRRGNSRFSDYGNGWKYTNRERMLKDLDRLREYNEKTNRYTDIKVQRRTIKTEIGNWKDGIGIE